MPIDQPIAQTHRIGEHTVVAEGDVVFCYYKGTVAIDQLVAAHRIIEAALAAHPVVYQVIDLGAVPMPSAELRRWVAKWAQTHHLRAVISFNVSPPLRVIMSFLQNAIRLVNGNAPLAPCFRNEQEARAFIEEDRKQQR